LGQQLGPTSFYQRGPHTFGNDLRDEAQAAYRWLKAAHEDDPELRLMLAGYSRGGSAAIMVCEWLQQDGIEVDSLFLFDAVARHKFPGGAVIPANVRFSRHARRHLSEEFIAKYEGTLRQISLLGGLQNPARPNFGNVGLLWRGTGDHAPAEAFLGSHGAIGGVGWGFVLEDSDCERQVATWMNEHLLSRGVEASLDAAPPRDDAKPTHPSHLERWLTHNIYQFIEEHDEPHHKAAESGAEADGASRRP
jgi:hypothetical protein